MTSTRMMISVEWIEGSGPAVIATRYNPETKKHDGETRVLSSDPRDVILASLEDRLYMIEQSLDQIESRIGSAER